MLAVLLAVAGLALIGAGGWRGSGSVSGGAGVALVVASRSLDAGTVLASGDVQLVQVVPSDALSGLAHAPGDVVGRRLAVAVPAGLPLSGSLLTAAPVASAGRRLVRLPLDAAAVAPDLAPGAVVDIVAAVPDGADGGRVLSVATARVVEVGGGSSPVATLDVDDAGAARLVWAETFAKSLRVLVRASTASDTAPPDVSSLRP